MTPSSGCPATTADKSGAGGRFDVRTERVVGAVPVGGGCWATATLVPHSNAISAIEGHTSERLSGADMGPNLCLVDAVPCRRP